MKLSGKIAADMLGKRKPKEFLEVYEKYALVCSYENFWKISVELGILLPKSLGSFKRTAQSETPKESVLETAIEYAQKRREFQYSDFRDYLYDKTGFYTKSSATNALGKLIELGYVERVTLGVYRSMAA